MWANSKANPQGVRSQKLEVRRVTDETREDGSRDDDTNG